MINLSKVTCPILNILRRYVAIPKEGPDKKEVLPSTLGVSLPDLGSIYKEPRPTKGQEVVAYYRGF